MGRVPPYLCTVLPVSTLRIQCLHLKVTALQKCILSADCSCGEIAPQQRQQLLVSWSRWVSYVTMDTIV